MIEYTELIKWIFFGLLGFICWRGVDALDNIKNSIADLNVNVAVLLEKVSTHEKRLDDHEEILKEIKK